MPLATAHRPSVCSLRPPRTGSPESSRIGGRKTAKSTRINTARMTLSSRTDDGCEPGGAVGARLGIARLMSHDSPCATPHATTMARATAVPTTLQVGACSKRDGQGFTTRTMLPGHWAIGLLGYWVIGL